MNGLSTMSGKAGARLRWLWKRFGNIARNFIMFRIRYPWVKYGKDVHVQLTTTFFSPHEETVIGDHVGIGQNCEFGCDIRIGNHVLIGSGCGFLSRDAHTAHVPGATIYESPRGDKYGIKVGDDVWIGFNTIVLSGVTIGRGSIVGAGSVVTSDVPPYSISFGSPSRVSRSRFTPQQIAEHERILTGRGILREETADARRADLRTAN